MTYALPSHPDQTAPTGAMEQGNGPAPLVICHQMRAIRRDQTAPALLRRKVAIIASWRPMTEGRGAMGRASCLPNRASHPATTVGLLRRAWCGMGSDGAGDVQVKGRSGAALAGDAGASAIKGLIGVLRASRHASPTKTGPLWPRQPCMNGLPAHAPITPDRRSRPDRLYACTVSAGVEKLH